MRTIRLAIIGESPCGACYAACCKQNGHEFAALLQGEDELRRFRPFAQSVVMASGGAHPVVERVLPYRDGRCVFLGSDDRCTVYEDRPQACRAFQCVTSFNAHGISRHGEFLARNPRVLDLLKSM